MQTTSNLELKKPSENDFIDIEDLNYNAEKLDKKMQEIVGNIEGLSGLKDSIQLTTDAEFVNSLINNTAKAGSVLLFSNIGERNGNISGENYTLYAGLANCNQYSGCDITVKTLGAVAEQNLHPMYFQVPSYYIAKVDKQNAKKVVISPLESGKGDIDVLQERIDSVEERANQAFTQAGEGKKAIVNAFTGLGISASSSETFRSLADKIKNKALNKERIANALTNKGVPTDTNATQRQIVESINTLQTIEYGILQRANPDANGGKGEMLSFPSRCTHLILSMPDYTEYESLVHLDRSRQIGYSRPVFGYMHFAELKSTYVGIQEGGTWGTIYVRPIIWGNATTTDVTWIAF